MSVNILEKMFMVGTLGASALFIGSMYFRSNAGEKKDAFKVRQQLLKQEDVKMLYSTISFFYLQGFHPKSIESFFTMQKILEIEKPNMVVLPISKDDYEEKYLKVMKHPKYREAMDKFIFNLKNRNKEEIQKIEDFELKNLQKLYLIDHCIRLKKCQLVFARRSKQQYQSIFQAQQKIFKEQRAQTLTIENLKIQDYTQKIIDKMNTKNKISFLPQQPFKTIVGIIEPELLYNTGKKWKQKFKQNYKHIVIEDEQVLERQRLNREAQNKT